MLVIECAPTWNWLRKEYWADMKLKLGEISERGLDVNAELVDEWARDAVALALDGEPQSLQFRARVQRVSDCVRVFGHLEASANRDCDRCQVRLTVSMSGEMDLYYAPPRPGDGGDRDLDEGDLDIGWFDGQALELSQVISEQLAIWSPDRIDCEDPCSTRVIASDAPCEIPPHDGGPDLKPQSPFAKIRLPD